MDIRKIDHIIIVAWTKEGQMLAFDKKQDNVYSEAIRWMEQLNH